MQRKYFVLVALIFALLLLYQGNLIASRIEPDIPSNSFEIHHAETKPEKTVEVVSEKDIGIIKRIEEQIPQVLMPLYDTLKQYSEKKIVLCWNEVLISGYERVKDFSGCEYSNCEWTEEKSRLDEANAVILYVPHFNWNYTIRPPVRRPDQPWIMFSIESPYITDGKFINVTFNWTMTYRRDADIPYLYEEPVPYNPGSVSKKYGKIMWMASNCYPPNDRHKYILELMKHTQVDALGWCWHNKDGLEINGKMITPQGRMGYNWNDNNKVYAAYKFYLAFENVNCYDYVTEKFWWPLRHGAVPVVFGAPNIKDYAPHPTSIIDTADFESPKALAEFLDKLDKDDHLYNQYHLWRTMDTEKLNPKYQEIIKIRSACKLCEALHTKKGYQSIPDERLFNKSDECVKHPQNLDTFPSG